MESAVTRLFTDAQKTLATHQKLVKKLIAVYLKSDFDPFFSHFVHLLKFSLIHGEKQAIIERTLSFIALFSTSVKSDKEEDAANAKKESCNNAEEEWEEFEVDPFLVSLFEFLLEKHEANSKAVRFRVCQLINKLLNNMGEQASIDDDLYKKIYDAMLNRLMDKIPNVRVQAIHALSRLQDPKNRECPVIKAYLFHLSMDPNPEVRRAVLTSIAVTVQTLPHILKRTRDTLDLVRRQAYLILAQKVHIRSFTIAQRVNIISEGLNDRSKMVCNSVKKNILQSWLRVFDGSILELLKCLDVEASSEGAELALTCLFEGVDYNSLLEKFSGLLNAKVIPTQDIKAESALFWKCLAKHFRDEKADEYFDMILPDLTLFCDYLRAYILEQAPEDEDPQETAIHLMEKDFICQQLLSILPFFDLTDEVGRNNLCNLVRLLFLTPDISETCIKILSEVMSMLYAPAARIDVLADIISELRTPPVTTAIAVQEDCQGDQVQAIEESEEEKRKRKIKIAQISVQINQLRDELEDCIRSLNLEKAQSLKATLQELEEQKARAAQDAVCSKVVVPCSQNVMIEDEEINLRDDPDTLSRCLSIVCGVLSKPDVTNFSSTLRSLHDNLILPSLKSEDLGVRRCAVKALVLCCHMSKELSAQYQMLFIQIARIDAEEIQLEALRGLFDIWQLYGLRDTPGAGGESSGTPGEDGGDSNAPGEGGEESNASGVGGEDSNASGVDGEPLDGPDGDSLDINGDSPSMNNVIALLSEMLNFESSEAKTLAAEGLCKLLLSSRINSSRLMSQLVVLWYNPVSEKDHLLRHMLGVFFPLYASLSSSNQECMSDALIPTLHAVFNAPHHSPLCDVDVEDVCSFLVSITRPSILSNSASEVSNVHDNLVFKICSEILACPNRDYVKCLIKSLNQLVLSPTKYSSLKQILGLVGKISKVVNEKLLLNTLQRFKKSVENMLESAPKVEEERTDECGSEEKDDNNEIIAPEQQEDILTGSPFLNPKRKRILYSNQTESELMSEADSESDVRSPMKLSKLYANSNLKKVGEREAAPASSHETNEEASVEKINNELYPSSNEIELTSQNSKSSSKEVNLSSSDLFGSYDTNKPKESQESSCLTDDDRADSQFTGSSDSSFHSALSSPSTSPPLARSKGRLSRSPSGSSKHKPVKSGTSEHQHDTHDSSFSTVFSGDNHPRKVSENSHKLKSKKRKSLRVLVKRLSIGTLKKNLNDERRVTRSSLSSDSPSSSGRVALTKVNRKKRSRSSSKRPVKRTPRLASQSSTDSNCSDQAMPKRRTSSRTNRNSSSDAQNSEGELRKSSRRK